jgi:hypothetical protein
MVFLLSHEKEDPVTKWKAMIGHRDPEVGKKDEPDSLR